MSRFYIHEGFLDAFPKEPKKEPKKELKRSQKGVERRQTILDLIAENPAITQSQLMEKLDLSRKQVQINIKRLQEEGALAREGSNRKGYWVLKHID